MNDDEKMRGWPLLAVWAGFAIFGLLFWWSVWEMLT